MHWFEESTNAMEEEVSDNKLPDGTSTVWRDTVKEQEKEKERDAGAKSGKRLTRCWVANNYHSFQFSFTFYYSLLPPFSRRNPSLLTNEFDIADQTLVMSSLSLFPSLFRFSECWLSERFPCAAGWSERYLIDWRVSVVERMPKKQRKEGKIFKLWNEEKVEFCDHLKSTNPSVLNCLYSFC